MSVYEHGPMYAKVALQFPPPGGSELRPLPFRDDLLRPADHTGAHASDGGTWSQRIYEHTPHLLFFIYFYFFFNNIGSWDPTQVLPPGSASVVLTEQSPQS